MCGIAGVARLNVRDVDTGAFYTALSLMKHRGPDDERMVLIDSNTGKFEERSGEDTPQELGLADIHIPTTLK